MKANKLEFFSNPKSLFPNPQTLCLLLIMANLAFSQGLSKKCVDELLALPDKKKNFDLQGFLTKDLPAEVVKVKAQMKLPFGKPKDDKVTDIGVTVGCLKGFPENAGQIQAMLKDVSLEMAKKGANKFGANALAGTSVGANGIAASINTGIIAAKISAAHALKECDAVFNTEKKFCHDGEVYDKCDGVVYNPSTHICNGDVANRAVCNGVQYNPLTQTCENNSVSATCGEAEYNPQTHNCKDNALFEFPKCGTVVYNPETHGCRNLAVLSKCGTDLYNQATHGCGEDNRVYPKCGANLYKPITHICENNTVVSKQVLVEEYKEEYYEEHEEYEKKKPERRTRFGIRANGGVATATNGGLGFGAGIFVLAPFSSIYFVPGISYSYRNLNTDFSDRRMIEKAIDIPLFFRFRYREENIIYIGIGALIGFVLSSDFNLNGLNLNEDRYFYSRNSFDLGAATELGFGVSDSFSIDTRMLVSFTPDYKYNYNSYSGSSSSSSNVLLQFQIGMSYLF